MTSSSELKVSISDVYFDDQLSSASGIENRNHSLYIIGDDIPWLLEIDFDFNVKTKFRLAGTDTLVNGRTPKDLKADFEALGFLNDTNLLVLSSGSLNHTRDTAYIFNIYSDNFLLLSCRNFSVSCSLYTFEHDFSGNGTRIISI